MDREEFLLQREGYREAIRHPDFVRAVLSGENRPDRGHLCRMVRRPLAEDHRAMAADRRRGKRRAVFRGALGAAARSRARHVDLRGGRVSAPRSSRRTALPGCERRSTSPATGRTITGAPVTEARDEAVEAGIVINGLPILIAPSPIVSDVARYYAECVIGGPGRLHAAGDEGGGISVAIRRKLILEVAGRFPATDRSDRRGGAGRLSRRREAARALRRPLLSGARQLAERLPNNFAAAFSCLT